MSSVSLNPLRRFPVTRAPLSRLLPAALAAFLFSGCTSNPLLSFRHPREIAPATLPAPNPEALKPAAASASPVVIEITDGGYPLEYIYKQAGLGEAFVAAAAGDNSHQIKFQRQRLETSPLRALWWSANVNLYKTELADTLRAAYPDAVVYVRSIPYAERETFARTFPPRFDHRHNPASPPPLSFADLVVTVENTQGIEGNDANYAGQTFGSSLFVTFSVAPAGTTAAPFTTRAGAGGSPRLDETIAAAYAAAPTAEELAQTRAKIASAHWSVRAEWGTPAFASRFFLNYPGDAAYLAVAEPHLARFSRSAVTHGLYRTGPRGRTDADTLQSWNTDPATSPLAPFYKWTVAGVGEVAPLAVTPSARAARLEAWASGYEPDPALRAAFAAHAAGAPEALALDALPPKARALASLLAAEINFAVRHGEALAEIPARGELGAFARQAAVEQEGLRKGFENRLLAANLIGFAGAGIGAGMAGSASALVAQGAAQATITAAQAMLAKTIDDAESGAADMAAAITDQIGAITLDLNGQSVAVTAPDITSFRTQLRSLYAQL